MNYIHPIAHSLCKAQVSKHNCVGCASKANGSLREGRPWKEVVCVYGKFCEFEAVTRRNSKKASTANGPVYYINGLGEASTDCGSLA